jgi:hypothetical protein
MSDVPLHAESAEDDADAVAELQTDRDIDGGDQRMRNSMSRKQFGDNRRRDREKDRGEKNENGKTAR